MNQLPEPQSENLFSPVPDSYGTRLALVFGNHAAGGVCPFYAGSRCRHCDIGAGEGRQFTLRANRERLAWYQQYFEGEWPSVNHLLLYNSGSMLNPGEMPSEFLADIFAFARQHLSMRLVSLDSRESFITAERVRRVCEQLRDDQSLRVIIGIETADDNIRDRILRKRMPRKAIERAFESLRRAAANVGRHRIGVGVNVLVGTPGTRATTALDDAVNTVRFALERTDLPVDFNVHPYYPSMRGIQCFPSHSRCSWPFLVRAAWTIAQLCNEMSTDCRIFVGLNDEGHDTESCDRIDQRRDWKECIDEFNRTQNPAVLFPLPS